MVRRTWAAMLLGILLCAGCPKRQRGDLSMIANEFIRLADHHWSRRDTLGYGPALDTLHAAYTAAPGNPDVLWRIVRVHTHRGMAAEDRAEALDAYAEARARGLECLDAHDPFRQRRVDLEDWEAAVETLPDRRMACAAWTALAWARWMAAMGAEGASLDLVPTDLLAGKAASAADRDVVAVAAWARGVLASARPSWAGRDLELAVDELQSALERDPDDLPVMADLLFLGAVPSGELELADEVVKTAEATTPEDPAGERARAQILAWKEES